MGAIWVVAAQVYANNQVRTTLQQLVTSIAQNVRAIFAEQGGITGDNTSNINQALDQLKVFPSICARLHKPTGSYFFESGDVF